MRELAVLLLLCAGNFLVLARRTVKYDGVWELEGKVRGAWTDKVTLSSLVSGRWVITGLRKRRKMHGKATDIPSIAVYSTDLFFLFAMLVS